MTHNGQKIVEKPAPTRSDLLDQTLAKFLEYGVGTPDFMPGPPSHFAVLPSQDVAGTVCDVIAYDEFLPNTRSHPYHFTLWLSRASHLPVKRACDASGVDFYYKDGQISEKKPVDVGDYSQLRPFTRTETYSEISVSARFSGYTFKLPLQNAAR